MLNCLVGVAFVVSRRHDKLHALAKQLMGGACRKHACIQIYGVEANFKTKVGS